MTVSEKLLKIREYMKADNVSVYIVTSSDYHNSEYTGAYFETRKFLSHFTGSAGTLVIGRNEAALYTDGRYFIQAEMELQGSGIKLMKMGIPDTPDIKDYVSQLCENDSNIGIDTRTIPAKSGLIYEDVAAKKGRSRVIFSDYAGMIWDDRPSLSRNPAFELDIKYAGMSREDKLCNVRKEMKKNGCNVHILTTLDDIAWLLNIRGNDIEYNPMVLSYLCIYEDEACLYSDTLKYSDELKSKLLKAGVRIKDYGTFYDDMKLLKKTDVVMYDREKINYYLYTIIKDKASYCECSNPEILMKAVKNHVECENERRAHIKDGVAVTKFIYWLKHNIGKIDINEVSAADYLEERRKEQEGYIEPSFSTISAYNANAAMMHYNPYNSGGAKLNDSGLLLVDSGGQYYEGTTDITRTIALGAVSDEIKIHYTAVLKGMLNLSDARFLKGCCGINLDILARRPLWDMGLDYRCGTGHGVGYMLSVHEAPNGFRWRKVPERDDGCVLVPGMITTDEPGVYIEGSHGIRIENELLCISDTENEYGQFLKFETLTVAPVEMDLVRLQDLNEKEKELLRNYQKKVYDTISSYLGNDEKQWLYKVCCEF